MVIVGTSEEELETIFDNLDGKIPVEHFPLPATATYGEIYGFLPASKFAQYLPSEAGHFAELLEEAVQNVELHADTMSDVSMSVSLKGEEATRVEQLSKRLGGMLALALKSAQLQGDENLARLLEHANECRRLVRPEPLEL